MLAALTRRDTGFVWLARQLAVERAARVEKLGIEGLDFIEESVREYPRKFLASQLLGFTGTDNTGLSGLEHQHDADLRGRDGRRLLVKDALGDAIRLDDQRRPREGKTSSSPSTTASRRRPRRCWPRSARATGPPRGPPRS